MDGIGKDLLGKIFIPKTKNILRITWIVTVWTGGDLLGQAVLGWDWRGWALKGSERRGYTRQGFYPKLKI